MFPYSPPVFLLVVKITEKQEEIEKAVTKWLNFITHYSLKVKTEAEAMKVKTPNQPQLIIIASHVDSLSQENYQLQKKFIKVPHSEYYDFSEQIIPLDYRYPTSSDIEELFKQLKQHCSLKNIKVDVGCRFLHGYLMKNKTKAISVASLAEDIKNEGVLLPSNPSSLFELASQLNETGHILLLKSDDKDGESWIVTDSFRRVLLCDVIGSLPEIANKSSAAQPVRRDFNSHSELDRRRFSIVSHSELCKLFIKLNEGSDTELIIKLLIHLEFCHIVKQENFKCLKLNTKDKYYFFPQWHDVSKDKPGSSGQKWELHGNIKCGWYLECVGGSRLASKLLYVLLQQLVDFLFNLDEQEGKGVTIWQQGLRWTGNSVKTVVEVGKHNESVVVLASCRSDCKIKCAQNWTNIISLILGITCHDAVEVKESLIRPEKVAYPVEVTDAALLPLNYLAKQSLESESGTSLTCGKDEQLIDSKELFNNVFDPYYGLDKDKLWKHFGEVKTARGDFLETIADLMHKTKISFEAVSTGEEVTLQMKQFEHSDSPECLKILQRLTDNGKDIHTMQKLQRKLNECSILYWHLVTLVMTVNHNGECFNVSMQPWQL